MIQPPSFQDMEDLASRLHLIQADDAFVKARNAVHAFQRANNPVYRRYLDSLGVPGPAAVPVDVFKHVAVTSHPADDSEIVFQSSGTGDGAVRSAHHVRFAKLYARSCEQGFRRVFGPGPFVMVSHVPAYAPASSLVWMLHHLASVFGAEGSGFSADDPSVLEKGIRNAAGSGRPLMLFGAAFGLLDLAESRKYHLPADSIVVETGGMKTHRKERTRDVLHAELADGFGVLPSTIRSEYGMCELLSQCYSEPTDEDGRPGPFMPPPWVRFRVVSLANDGAECREGEEGILEITDLANMFSLSFVRTEDRAVRTGNGFHILGRAHGAALRGCNFLLE